MCDLLTQIYEGRLFQGSATAEKRVDPAAASALLLCCTKSQNVTGASSYLNLTYSTFKVIHVSYTAGHYWTRKLDFTQLHL
jgi:hypothetical protein